MLECFWGLVVGAWGKGVLLRFRMKSRVHQRRQRAYLITSKAPRKLVGLIAADLVPGYGGVGEVRLSQMFELLLTMR